MKWVHMGNIKSSIDCELLYHLYLLRVHPYGVNRTYSTLVEVEYQLLKNTILLMDGVLMSTLCTHFILTFWLVFRVFLSY